MRNRITGRSAFFSILAVALVLFVAQSVTVAQMGQSPAEAPIQPFTFEVTLTNLTKGVPGEAGQIFSPPLIVTHGGRTRFVQMGTPASDELRMLAEDGNNGPLAAFAADSDRILDLVALDAPLLPGESVTVSITAGPVGSHLSLATMLVQTNDGIVAADGLEIFDENLRPRRFAMDLLAYDAGTEVNNELATHVPGPPFGGGERVPETDVIRRHPGIAGDADIGMQFGWEGPVAHLTVTPIGAPPPVDRPTPGLDNFDFEVTLTNLTEGAPGEAGQIFSPPLIATHTPRISLFQLGSAASDELRILAEDGINGPLAALAADMRNMVRDVVALDGPLLPGESVRAVITGGPMGVSLSLAAMLVQTNDGIVAANSLPLFDENGKPRGFTVDLMAYDAGTEANNELATHVPGPPFGGGERVPETDVIRPHPGIIGNGDIGAEFGWRGPVARLTVMPAVKPPPPPFEPIVARGYAALNGEQQIHDVLTDAAGTAVIHFSDDGDQAAVRFEITVTGLSGPITGAHFHGPAPAGEAGPVIFDITDTFAGNHARGAWIGLTKDNIHDLMKGMMYLNVHTEANPPGEIRGQIHGFGRVGIGYTALSGFNEVPPVETDAVGTGVFRFVDDGRAISIWYKVTVAGLSGPITGAHFHGPAMEDENAPVIFDITETFDGDHAEGVWEPLPREQLAHLVRGGVYVNIHTAANPPGEIRGQVHGVEPVREPPPPPPPDLLPFEITLTNLTQGAPGEAGQIFSPPLIVVHNPNFNIVRRGEPASDELRILAEDGNNDPLAVRSRDAGPFLALRDGLPPGKSITEVLPAGFDYPYLSLATMLVQTNDGIVAVDSVPLFDEDGHPREIEIDLFAYDAGTEENNELKTHVPGPPFGGQERAPTRGVVERHPGITGRGDVGLEFGWEGPVAHLSVRPLDRPPFEPDEFPQLVARGYAALSGDQEVPSVATDAAGTAFIDLVATKDETTLFYNIIVTGLSGPITGAHFHGPAPAGSNAGVIFDITDSFHGSLAFGEWRGLTHEQVEALVDGLIYLNIHTEANPPGEIRGQVNMGNPAVTFLGGFQEVPPVETDAGGIGIFKLVNDRTGLWYNITVADLSGPIIGAHFHGPARFEENAGVIFDITANFEGNHAEGVWDLSPEARQYVLAGQVYVNIHTEKYPPGEVRGQIFGLTLSAAAEEESQVFFMELDPGLNSISLPLMSPVPYTASRLVNEVGATVVIRLDHAAQEFIGFTAESEEADDFLINGGEGYIINVLDRRIVPFVGTAWRNTPPGIPAAPGTDVHTTAWAFILSGEMQEGQIGSDYKVVVKNLRSGTVATDIASVDRNRFAAVWADLSRKSVVEAGDTLEVVLLDNLENIVSGPFRRQVEIADIRKAYLSLPLIVGDVHPADTVLAQNFPNPFNPETWIPYQLAAPSEITVQIHDLSGRLVRTLDIGFKPTGFYTTRSMSAYWDGRNNTGERVASGVYFYTLQTKDFAATRKMLIAK